MPRAQSPKGERALVRVRGDAGHVLSRAAEDGRKETTEVPRSFPAVAPPGQITNTFAGYRTAKPSDSPQASVMPPVRCDELVVPWGAQLIPDLIAPSPGEPAAAEPRQERQARVGGRGHAHGLEERSPPEAASEPPAHALRWIAPAHPSVRPTFALVASCRPPGGVRWWRPHPLTPQR